MIKSIVLSFVILCIFADAAHAARSFFYGRAFLYYPNNLADATGTVEATGLNFIELNDEEQKRPVRFIYLGDTGQFHPGDHIRIYYHPQDGVATKIKRMTVLEYKENGQNLGFISHKTP